jgi:hypothetical protein
MTWGKVLAGEIVIGLILTISTGFFMRNATEAARTYALDSTCREGFNLAESETGGACSVTDARLTATWRVTGNSNDYHYIHYVNVRFANGRNVRFTAYTNDMDVWNAARAHPGIGARVQLLHGSIAEVQTADGRLATSQLPVNVLGTLDGFFALGLGFLMAALLQGVLSALILSS